MPPTRFPVRRDLPAFSMRRRPSPPTAPRAKTKLPFPFPKRVTAHLHPSISCDTCLRAFGRRHRFRFCLCPLSDRSPEKPTPQRTHVLSTADEPFCGPFPFSLFTFRPRSLPLFQKRPLLRLLAPLSRLAPLCSPSHNRPKRIHPAPFPDPLTARHPPDRIPNSQFHDIFICLPMGSATCRPFRYVCRFPSISPPLPIQLGPWAAKWPLSHVRFLPPRMCRGSFLVLSWFAGTWAHRVCAPTFCCPPTKRCDDATGALQVRMSLVRPNGWHSCFGYIAFVFADEAAVKRNRTHRTSWIACRLFLSPYLFPFFSFVAYPTFSLSPNIIAFGR